MKLILLEYIALVINKFFHFIYRFKFCIQINSFIEKSNFFILRKKKFHAELLDVIIKCKLFWNYISGCKKNSSFDEEISVFHARKASKKTIQEENRGDALIN